MTEQEHLLICLMEECGEVIQACSKAFRFGLDDDHQAANPDIVSPRKYIQKELNDLIAVTGMLMDRSVLPTSWIDSGMVHAKREKLAGMMKYARRQGSLEEISEAKP